MFRRLVLWDVDGTLLRAGDIGAAVFDDAIEAVLGVRPPERVRMSGKTDPLIVREYLAMMGVSDTPGTPGTPETTEIVEQVLERLVEGLAAASAAGTLLRTGAACAGAAEVLAGLAAVPGVVQSLLTGNLHANAVVKVTAYGLDRWLDLEIGAYGSDSEDRNRLVPIACRRFEQATGTPVAPSDVWVIGDTPRDLACARAAGARCLLVATGRYSYADLSGLGADAVRSDLSDAAEVVDLVASPARPESAMERG